MQSMTFNQWTFLALAFAASCVLQSACAAQAFEIRTVSSRSDTVSGGTALVQLDAPSNSNWSVHLDNRDITPLFRRSQRSGKLLAHLNGLRIGKNSLEVRVGGTARSKIQILNYPLAGPIFSGPHQQPFICQTKANGLGPALDVDCAAKTVVQYYYKSTEKPHISSRDMAIAKIDAISSPTPMTLEPGFKLYDPSGPR